MIYLGYNRDLDSVAHFWGDSLRAFLFEKREDKHRPFLRIGKQRNIISITILSFPNGKDM